MRILNIFLDKKDSVINLINMGNKHDTIKLIIETPPETEASWLAYNRCKILINNEDILDIVTKAEYPFFKSTRDLDENYAGKYIHMIPSELYEELVTALNSNGTDEAPILCCICGESGCGSARVKVIKNKNSVIWNNFRTIRNWDLGLSFEFDIEEYEKFMEQLKNTLDK